MLQYTKINHIARKELGLSWMEYGFADMIFYLSANPNSPVPYYCSMSRPNMAKEMGVSKRTIINYISRLIDDGLIEKHPDNDCIRTTQKWYDLTVVEGGEKNAPPSKNGEKIARQGVKKLHDTGAKISPNNNRDNNKEDNTLSPARKKIERTESGSVDVKSLKNRIAEEAPPVAAAPPEEIDEFELLDDAVADLTRKATVSQQRLEVFNMSSMHKRTMDQAKEEAGRFAKWYMGRKIDEGWDAIRIANHFKAMKPSEAQAKYNASFWNKPYSQPQNNEQSTRNKKSERVYRSWDEVKSRLTA